MAWLTRTTLRDSRYDSLFGSALRDDCTPESDVDVLVEFLPGYVPGFEFVTERELSSLLQGRRVDLVGGEFPIVRSKHP